MKEKSHFYFQENYTNKMGIIPLKFLNLSFYNAFQTKENKSNLTFLLQSMFHFKLDNSVNHIYDFYEIIDEDSITEIFSNIKPENQEDNSRKFFIISENSFNNASNKSKTLLKSISTRGREFNCHLFLSDSNKTFLDFNNERIVFAPMDSVTSCLIDPITSILGNDGIKKSFKFAVSAKDLWKMPNSPLGIILFPVVIPFWSLLNFLSIKIRKFNIGSIICHKNYPEEIFGVVFKDQKYLYVSLIKTQEKGSQIYSFEGLIVGKIPIKNNNFIALNWMET